MGLRPSKSHTVSEKDYKKLSHRISLLQQEITAMMSQREEESRAYERELVAFTCKEAAWRRERKRLREEVRRLRRRLKKKETESEETLLKGGGEKVGWCCEVEGVGVGLTVEEMIREERARRDEAVEKWKMLYLAIKAELDDLVQRAHQGGALYLGAGEEDFMEDIRRELKAKDETIEVLRAQVTSMEQEECKRKREVDILRQSLRIMSSKKKAAAAKYAC